MQVYEMVHVCMCMHVHMSMHDTYVYSIYASVCINIWKYGKLFLLLLPQNTQHDVCLSLFASLSEPKHYLGRVAPVLFLAVFLVSERDPDPTLCSERIHLAIA